MYVCFPFISDEFPKIYVERKFKQIIDEKNPNEKEYNKYKFLEASQYHYGIIVSSPTIQFVHPSLSEALPYLLMRNNLSKPDLYIQDLFSKVLVYLGYDPINLETICYFILKNYEILVNKDVKNLLNKVMDSKDFKYGIFNEVFANFDKIEEPLKTKAIELLKTDYDVASSISDFLRSNLDKLPSSAIHKVFELATTNYHVAYNISDFLRSNPDKLPYSVIDKVFELAKTNDNVASSISNFLRSNPDKLPYSVIDKVLELAKTDDEVANSISDFLKNNFDYLPSFYLIGKFLDALLLHIDSKEEIAMSVLRITYFFYEELDSNLRNRLLLKLRDSKFHDVFNMMNSFIIGNFNIIDNNTLSTLLQNEHIVNYLKRNSSLVDETLKKKLN